MISKGGIYLLNSPQDKPLHEYYHSFTHMKVTQHEDSLWRKSDKKTTLLINEELQDHPKRHDRRYMHQLWRTWQRTQQVNYLSSMKNNHGCRRIWRISLTCSHPTIQLPYHVMTTKRVPASSLCWYRTGIRHKGIHEEVLKLPRIPQVNEEYKRLCISQRRSKWGAHASPFLEWGRPWKARTHPRQRIPSQM